MGWDGAARGVLAVADELKPHAADVVRALRGRGVEVVMITGDNEATAAAVGRRAGIDRVVAGVLPGQKAAEVERLQADGPRGRDGGRRASTTRRPWPRPTSASRSGTGTDVAIEASDLTLIRGDLEGVPASIDLSRRTFRVIVENLVWAFGYNVAAIPLAALGLLNPIVAGAAMAFSSVSVVSNSLRLRRFGR